MQGDSLLHALCAKGLANAVATLLRRGVHVNIVNKVSYSVLIFICVSSHTVNSTDKEYIYLPCGGNPVQPACCS